MCTLTGKEEKDQGLFFKMSSCVPGTNKKNILSNYGALLASPNTPVLHAEEASKWLYAAAYSPKHSEKMKVIME